MNPGKQRSDEPFVQWLEAAIDDLCRGEPEVEHNVEIEAALEKAVIAGLARVEYSEDLGKIWVFGTRIKAREYERTMRKINGIFRHQNENPPFPEFPRLWTLLSFSIPRGVRERVYQPVHQELLEDFFRALVERPGKWERRWLTFCFFARSVVMVAECLRVWMGDKGTRILYRIFLALLGAEALKNLRGFFIEVIGKL